MPEPDWREDPWGWVDWKAERMLRAHESRTMLRDVNKFDFYNHARALLIDLQHDEIKRRNGWIDPAEVAQCPECGGLDPKPSDVPCPACRQIRRLEHECDAAGRCCLNCGDTLTT